MDLATLDERRVALADKIKELPDVTLPRLSAWNYGPCDRHKDVGPQVSCEYRACGGELFSHQRVSTAWLYAIKHGLLASEPGTGKTATLLYLIALLKQQGDLFRRALLIPNTPAVKQWAAEAQRWAPGLNVVAVDGSTPKPQRLAQYATDWDVLILGQHVAINDQANLENLCPFDLVASDDVDALLNSKNRAHRTIRALSQGATRTFTVNATAVQLSYLQLHAALVPAGGYDVFGTKSQFENRYVRKERVTIINDDGTTAHRKKTTGYKHTEELKEKFSHLYVRHRAADLHDVRMPELMPPVIEWFDMSPRQRELYTELQQGVLTLIKEEGVSIKRVNALTQFNFGQQICAGLPALGLPDGEGASPKLDHLFRNLETVWSDRKVIAFVKNVGMVRATIERAQKAGIGLAMVWGQKQNADQRQEQVDKFWQDDTCNLLIGTTSLERSLNLQCANTVVMLDTHLNPARCAQILGRAKRTGSRHDHVYLFNYFMTDSQEEKYLKVLSERAALADHVFSENSEIFESLSAFELLQLLQP